MDILVTSLMFVSNLLDSTSFYAPFYEEQFVLFLYSFKMYS